MNLNWVKLGFEVRLALLKMSAGPIYFFENKFRGVRPTVEHIGANLKCNLTFNPLDANYLIDFGLKV